MQEITSTSIRYFGDFFEKNDSIYVLSFFILITLPLQNLIFSVFYSFVLLAHKSDYLTYESCKKK
jgi:hypothetical protein